jgi:hypothetical protein
MKISEGEECSKSVKVSSFQFAVLVGPANWRLETEDNLLRGL